MLTVLHCLAAACRYGRSRRAGSTAEMMDAPLGDQYPQIEMLNCVKIRLLCVLHYPSFRPDVPAVTQLLASQLTKLQTSSRPVLYSGSSRALPGTRLVEVHVLVWRRLQGRR